MGVRNPSPNSFRVSQSPFKSIISLYPRIIKNINKLQHLTPALTGQRFIGTFDGCPRFPWVSTIPFSTIFTISVHGRFSMGVHDFYDFFHLGGCPRFLIWMGNLGGIWVGVHDFLFPSPEFGWVSTISLHDFPHDFPTISAGNCR